MARPLFDAHRAELFSDPYAPGATVWLTGPSRPAKASIALALAERLRSLDAAVEMVDGTAVHPVDSGCLGESEGEDRLNVESIGWLAELLACNGMIALASVVSAYADSFAKVRLSHERSGTCFVEIHIASARPRPALKPGSSIAPELWLDPTARSVDEIVDEILGAIDAARRRPQHLTEARLGQ